MFLLISIAVLLLLVALFLAFGSNLRIGGPGASGREVTRGPSRFAPRSTTHWIGSGRPDSRSWRRGSRPSWPPAWSKGSSVSSTSAFGHRPRSSMPRAGSRTRRVGRSGRWPRTRSPWSTSRSRRERCSGSRGSTSSMSMAEPRSGRKRPTRCQGSRFRRQGPPRSTGTGRSRPQPPAECITAASRPIPRRLGSRRRTSFA